MDSRNAHVEGRRRSALEPRYDAVWNHPQRAVPVRRRRGLFSSGDTLAQWLHNIDAGDPLPDTLTGLLTASAFTYTIAVAPLMFAQGSSIGDSAIHRDSYNAYVQDTWKATGRLTLNYGLRYEITSPIREEDKRTSAPVLSGGTGLPDRS